MSSAVTPVAGVPRLGYAPAGFRGIEEPVNSAPVADDKTVVTDEDAAVPVTLTGSDVETPPGDLVFNVTQQPAHGTLSGTLPNLAYTPAANYNGVDNFSYTLTDTGNGASPPLTSAPATVGITVNPVNDPPVAKIDVAFCSEHATIIGSVLDNDSDVDAETTLTVTFVTVGGVTTAVPASGTLTFAALQGVFTIRADGHFSYTNDGSDFTSDGFTYTISDNGTADPGHTATNYVAIGIFNVVPLVTTGGGGISGTAGQPVSGRTYTFADPGDEGRWDVTFDFGDGSPPVTETRNAPDTYAVPSHAYATAGAKTVTVSVSDGESSGRAEYQVDIASSQFRVTAFAPTPSGFDVTFNRPFGGASLNLYGASSDVVVVGPDGQLVRGSLVWDNGSPTLSFVASGAYKVGPSKAGVLAPGTYSVALIAGAAALNDGLGNNLDGGTGDLVTGGDYTTTFTVAAPPAGGRTVSIDDFARGPGQAVNVTNDSATGIPINISDRGGITSFQLTLSYDASLLNVTGVGAPAAGWSVAMTSSSPGATVGRVTLTLSGDGPALPEGFGPLSFVRAAVRSGVSYGDSQRLDLEVQSLRDAGSNVIPATADDAVHSVNYVGDANGNQLYSSTDAVLILGHVASNNANPALYPNFSAYRNTDAAVVADTNNNSVLTSGDATQVLAEVSGILNSNPGSPLIPAIPPAPPVSAGKGVKRMVVESNLLSTVFGNVGTSTDWTRLSDELKRSTKLDDNGAPAGLFSQTPVRARIVPARRG